MCNITPVGLVCIFSLKELGDRLLDFLFYASAFLIVWVLAKPLSWSELIFILVLLAAYLTFECGGPIYVFGRFHEALKAWLNKPPVCNNCQGTEFCTPDWWQEEMAGIPLSLVESDSSVRLRTPPPQECVKCKELKM